MCAGVQFIFYFLFGNMQVAFAFLLSCFFKTTRTANITCWIWVLGSSLVANFLLVNVYARERWWATLVQLIPSFGAHRCVQSQHSQRRHTFQCIIVSMYTL